MKAKQKLRKAIDLLYSRGYARAEEYSRLLLECVRSNDVDQAKRLQSHMEFHLFNEPYLKNRLLQLYAKSGKISDARYLFDKMPHRDVFSWNAMLSMYSKWGSVDDLQVVFDLMTVRDLVSYNTVIAGFAGNGCSRKALEFFIGMQKHGFEPDEYTLVSLLKACSCLLDSKLGKQIHGRIVVCNLKGNVFVWNALTDMYGKCGEIDDARRLFDRMVDKNVVCWNSMISGYLRNGQSAECLDLFRKMQVSGIKPDPITVSSVLGAYFQRGLVEDARRIFREIRERDKVCWTIMIVGYVQNGKEEDALAFFNEMLSQNVIPDCFTISSVVTACSRLASLGHGKVIHSRSLHSGTESDLLVSSALVDMYAKCGEVSDARIVFEMMPTRNVISWNAMIIGYAQNGWDQEALALYNRMLQENFKADNVTFVGVLSAYSHSGLIEDGQRCFHSITDLHGMKPTLDHYACMINLLGRSGHIDEAVDLITGMPDEPNCLIWSTLLSVSIANGYIEHGEMAARHLFELEPLNAGPYIMLSNMYAASGRWEDVAFMRSLMKERKIRKFTAYSWIEINNKVHKFMSDDRTHPQTEKIYEELGTLIEKLQEAGFAPNTNLVLHDVREEEKFEAICYHSEKLALAFGLMSKPGGVPIRIMKNLRACFDCHLFMKFVSKILKQPIILRDSNRFHHFVHGQCSCKDNW